MAELPLPGDLAADLRRYMAGLPPDSSVFPLPEKGAAMLRADLEAAGIPYVDAVRAVLRLPRACGARCATLADAAGVSPRVVQKLMRHSSLELTGRYTRPRAVDIEAAASMLPSLKPDPEHPSIHSGRDRHRSRNPSENLCASFDPLRGRFGSDSVAS